jgi:hypothetical protein
MLSLSLLTILKITHLIGLIMGLGGAILADTTIFTRGVIRPVSAYTIYQAKFLSHVVSVGLAILWISGGALVWANTLVHPEYLTNQKLWAKIAIVLVLTVNGVLVHKLVLPLLKKSIGQRLFDHTSAKQVLGMTLLGSISLVSWTVPFILGKASELNYVTPMLNILAVYAGSLLIVWMSMFTVMSAIRKIQDYILRAAHLTMQSSANWERMRA